MFSQKLLPMLYLMEIAWNNGFIVFSFSDLFSLLAWHLHADAFRNKQTKSQVHSLRADISAELLGANHCNFIGFTFIWAPRLKIDVFRETKTSETNFINWVNKIAIVIPTPFLKIVFSIAFVEVTITNKCSQFNLMDRIVYKYTWLVKGFCKHTYYKL